jgi:hypothetical protein
MLWGDMVWFENDICFFFVLFLFGIWEFLGIWVERGLLGWFWWDLKGGRERGMGLFGCFRVDGNMGDIWWYGWVWIGYYMGLLFRENIGWRYVFFVLLWLTHFWHFSIDIDIYLFVRWSIGIDGIDYLMNWYWKNERYLEIWSQNICIIINILLFFLCFIWYRYPFFLSTWDIEYRVFFHQYFLLFAHIFWYKCFG